MLKYYPYSTDYSLKSMKYLLILMILFLILAEFQPVSAQQNIDPKGAFFRSMIVPGWGHYYNDKDNWNRGKVHLATEVGIIAAYIGFQQHSSSIRMEYITLANLRSGVDIRERSRSFQIALSDFPSLNDYNDYQLRTRNWNRLMEVNSENNWHWKSDRDRLHYSDLRSRRDRVKNQLPALFGIMVINRVISAINSYNQEIPPLNGIEVSVEPMVHDNVANGAITKIIYRF